MTKDEAITHFGGVVALADALGINRQAIYQWDEVPDKQQLRLEKMTNGALKANPDIVAVSHDDSNDSTKTEAA